LVPGDQLSEEEWARLVLKFWPLDDAARLIEYTDCSSNGAVKSGCSCHPVRVTFCEESLIETGIGVEDSSSSVSEDSNIVGNFRLQDGLNEDFSFTADISPIGKGEAFHAEYMSLLTDASLCNLMIEW
jgi:hypothetical protein